MSWSRASTPSMSPLTMCAATTAMASTGLTRNSSSGSASSQRRNVASCRARNAGIAAISMRSAARSKSSPSKAWPIAAAWSPLRAYQSLARRCSSCDLVALLVEQPGSQHVGEEMVVAVPEAPVVERDQEQVPPIEGLEHRPTAVLARHRIAERAVQPAQDRRAEQEAPDMLRLTLQDLADQVVDDEAVVAREAGDEAGDVVSSLHRERRELERRDPAFGAPLQRGDIARRQLQSHHFVEIGRGFVEREAKIGGPDLDEFAAGSEARQRQRRVGPAGDDQPDLRREVLHQVGHPVVDVGAPR